MYDLSIKSKVTDTLLKIKQMFNFVNSNVVNIKNLYISTNEFHLDKMLIRKVNTISRFCNYYMNKAMKDKINSRDIECIDTIANTIKLDEYKYCDFWHDNCDKSPAAFAKKADTYFKKCAITVLLTK